MEVIQELIKLAMMDLTVFPVKHEKPRVLSPRSRPLGDELPGQFIIKLFCLDQFSFIPDTASRRDNQRAK